MKVLLVEDNPELLEMTALALELDHHKVLTASSVRQARSLLTPKPDAIILDLYMPGEAGWTLLPDIPSDVPVIVMTGAHPGEIGKLPSTVKKVLIKPCDPSDLLESLSELEIPQ